MRLPADDRPLLLPVGQLGGGQRSAYNAPPDMYEVRIGAKVHELSPVEFVAWTLAHGDPDPAADSTDTPRPWGRAEVAARVFDSGVLGLPGAAGDPKSQIDGLLGRGLLVETPTHGPAAVAFAHAYRLIPTLTGLGNSAHDPWTYSMGALTQELVRVGRATFELWAWGAVEPDLWTVCETFADHERQAGATDPDTTEPTAVVAAFLANAHDLLSAQAGYFDVSGG